MEWTSMMEVLSDHINADNLAIYWPNGVIVSGTVDTISETCTCEFDESDPRFQEYYMCVVKITHIIYIPDGVNYNGNIGDFIELSSINEPLKIEDSNKKVIWKAEIIQHKRD